MITIKHRIFVFFVIAFFLTAVGLDAYHEEICYSIIPFTLLGGVVLIERPEYLLYSLVISIPWSVEYHFGANLSIDFPDEPFMLVSSVAAIFLFIYKRKEVSYKKIHPLFVIILLQFVWTIITVLTSTNVLLSIKYSLAKTWYLLALVALPLFLFKNETHLKRSSILLVISMLAAMIVVLIRQSQYDWSFKNVNDALTPFFHNHVIYSALLVFTVPAQIAFIQLTKSPKIKIFVSCLLTVALVALYFSYARGAWIALVAGLCSYWLLRKQVLLIGFLVFVFLSVGAVFWLGSSDRYLDYSNDYKTTIFHSNFQEHLIATYKLKDLSNAERIYRWVAGVQMAKDYWETGSGPTTFYEQYKSYTVPAFKTYVSVNKEHSTVHNYFLLMLIEQGIMGLLLFIVLVAFTFWHAQKIYLRANNKLWKVVAATIASIITMQIAVNFLSDLIETDKVGSVFYLCIAALVIADVKTRKQPSNFSTDVKGIS